MTDKSLEKRVSQEECRHPIVRFDGRQEDVDGCFVELYTCVYVCGATLAGREWVHNARYIGVHREDKKKYYWRD